MRSTPAVDCNNHKIQLSHLDKPIFDIPSSRRHSLNVIGRQSGLYSKCYLHFPRRSPGQKPCTVSSVLEEKNNISTHSGSVSVREKHKIFDEAVITVRSGKGGRGQIVNYGSGKYVDNLKYHAGGNQPKKLWLPASEPADGMAGGDVVLFCDLTKDTLVEFHEKRVYSASDGSNGNPEDGSQAPKKMISNQRPRKKAAALRIGVPPGTVVKRKGTGQFIGELLKAGDQLVVARGGLGGLGTVKPTRAKKKENKKRLKKIKDEEVDVVDVEDDEWKTETYGMPGTEITLRLLLRIVADIGFVGYPNAGKSALLSCLTRATPEIAPYPFTTLIPNLGVMGSGGDPVLVDLPGLIKGAHVGRGLGRNFLRHLRRTKVLMHIIDVSSPDPIYDYSSLREELRMYNSDYCIRPHLVVLNKIDLLNDDTILQSLSQGILNAAEEARDNLEEASLPTSVVLTSALDGAGILQLKEVLQSIVRESDSSIDNSVHLEYDKFRKKNSVDLKETNWGDE